MPNMLENLGLDFLNTEEAMSGLLHYLVQNGKALPAYTGTPYLFQSTGASEFWVRTERNEGGLLEVAGIDTHCGNLCIWKLAATDIDLSESYSEPMSRMMAFKNYEDGSGLIPIEVITPDVLPGPLDGDLVEMQVVGFPLYIRYYADQDEYEANWPEDEDGKKMMVANGSLFPSCFLSNHSVPLSEDRDFSTDSYLLFNATVKRVRNGSFKINDIHENTFIRCFVDTKYGELELAHPLSYVPQEFRKNIHEGAVVSGVCILSGDVALGEYENGLVKDEEHDLLALRYCFVRGSAERLYTILDENAVFTTAHAEEPFVGPKAIVDRLNFVHENHKGDYFAHMATITAVDEEDLEHPVGTRCVVLASDEERNYESIVFIRCSDEGMIENIEITTDGRYRFHIDERPVYKSLWDEIDIPENVTGPIYGRAKYHGLIGDNVTEDDLAMSPETNDAITLHVTELLQALSEYPNKDDAAVLENLFGYMFAKAVKEGGALASGSGAEVEYSSTEAFSGAAQIENIATYYFHDKEFLLGKQFYKDYETFVEMNGLDEEVPNETLVQALYAVQRVGHLNAKKEDE